MYFKEYLEKLNKIAEEHPESLEYTVIHSRDPEGNGYYEVESVLGVAMWSHDWESPICESDYEYNDPGELPELEPDIVVIN